MPDATEFSEYRQLILAHIDSSNRRQDAVEDQITDLKVAMGVLVLKVSFIVSLVIIVGGGVATGLVRTSLDGVLTSRNVATQAALEEVAELRDSLRLLLARLEQGDDGGN